MTTPIVIKPDNRPHVKTDVKEVTILDKKIKESFVSKLYEGAEVEKAKAADVKSADAKPADVKPTVAVKPTEVKPVEAKPIEVKPVEAKPVETKPVEVSPTIDPPVVDQPTIVPDEVIVADKPTTSALDPPAQVVDNQSALGDLINRLEAKSISYNIAELPSILNQSKELYVGKDKTTPEAKGEIVSNAYKLIVFKNSLTSASAAAHPKEGFAVDDSGKFSVECPINHYDQRFFMNVNGNCDDDVSQLDMARERCLAANRLYDYSNPVMIVRDDGKIVHYDQNGFGLAI